MDREQLVRDTWASLSRGELAALATALTPDARWRAVVEGPWDCENRAQIIEVMGHNIANGLGGTVEEIEAVGPDRLIVAFRPEHRDPGAWPLEDGIRHVVLSFDGDLVCEMKGCATRAAALQCAASQRG
jgi:hypothetical protein